MHEYYISYIDNKYMAFTFAQVEGTSCFILSILDVVLMHILDVILMHILDVRIRMHILDVLLLVLATMVTALLIGECQPQSNDAAGSVVAPKATKLSSTTVLKRKYD